MRLILVGPQGAGKGTQGQRLAVRYGAPHVAMGDLLRFAAKWETEIGLRAKEYMSRGELVPDEIVLELLKRRLSQQDAMDGFVLDGFPRNAAQADALNEMLEAIGQGIDAVVSLEVPDDVLVQRLSARASCPTCGSTYSLVDEKPTHCPKDGSELFQRDDDKPDVIRRRLQVFHDETRPLIGFYEKRGILRRVDGVGEVEEVEARVAKVLEDG